MREEVEYRKGPNWDGLAPDMWSCILMRLKPAQVMRWRWVSKSCRQVVDQNLLKDDFYVNEGVRASSPGIVVCTPFGNWDEGGVEISYLWANNDEHGLPLMTLKGTRSYLMGPSINGLICVVTDLVDTIVLCNPTTGESLSLPLCPVDPPFDSYWNYDRFGFGYSPSTDEYKLVHLCLHLCGEHGPVRVFECRVLTFRLSPHEQHQQQRSIDHIDSSSWRIIEHTFGYDDGFNDMNSGSVYVDGVIYWSGHTTCDYQRHNPGEPIDFIVCFHVRDEIFTTIPPPPTPARPYNYCSYLTELQERLGVGRLGRPDGLDYELDVWMLMGPGIWIRHLRIDFSMEPGLHTYALADCQFDFSCLSRDKLIVISRYTNTWSIYDIKSKSWVRRTIDFPLALAPVSSPIKESLLSL